MYLPDDDTVSTTNKKGTNALDLCYLTSHLCERQRPQGNPEELELHDSQRLHPEITQTTPATKQHELKPLLATDVAVPGFKAEYSVQCTIAFERALVLLYDHHLHRLRSTIARYTYTLTCTQKEGRGGALRTCRTARGVRTAGHGLESCQNSYHSSSCVLFSNSTTTTPLIFSLDLS